ncbi:hypothetical protein BJ912DRAFT_456599 [Pholiota molesta]|nr:hypothetical protein BJ912DRAFT_456599 [Pholiota molesta]
MASNTTSAPAPTGLDITSSYGGVLLGLIFSYTLYGVSCLQVFIYSMNCEGDPTFTKAMVGVLWLAETGNQICLVIGSWNTFVEKWGNLINLTAVQLGITHHIWVGHIVIISVQMYLARRIYLFGRSVGTRSRKIYMAMYLLVVVLLACGEITVIIVFIVKSYHGRNLSALTTPVETALNEALRILAATIDILVAIGMVYLLRATTPRLTKSKQLVQRMLIVTVSSGSLTAFFATIVMILLAVSPYHLWFCIFDFPLGSLYFNTLLANLNSRSYIRHGAPSSQAKGAREFDEHRGPSNCEGVITIGTARDPVRKKEESNGSDTVAPEADRNERLDEKKAIQSPRQHLESMVRGPGPEEARDTHTGLDKAPRAGMSGEKDTEQGLESGILQPSRENSQMPE